MQCSPFNNKKNWANPTAPHNDICCHQPNFVTSIQPNSWLQSPLQCCCPWSHHPNPHKLRGRQLWPNSWFHEDQHHWPALHRPHLPSLQPHHPPPTPQQTSRLSQPNLQLHYHQPLHEDTMLPKPVPHWPTFACWCQQHAALTLKIKQIIIHCKSEIFLSLLSTCTYHESTTARITNRICPADHPTQRHDTTNNPSKCNDSTCLPVPPTMNLVPMSRLCMTSTLQCHHVRFFPLPKAYYLPHICRTYIIFPTCTAATIIHQYYIQSMRPQLHAPRVQNTTNWISMTSQWTTCKSIPIPHQRFLVTALKTWELQECGSRISCK